jgi:MoxR-like ATPase
MVTTNASATLTELLATVKETTSTAVLQFRRGDHRDGSVYAPTGEILTAVQVALITGRPLLLSGPPGCGKSSLASFLARRLSFAYYEFVVTDESEPQDLLWHIDSIRRLNDAQLGKIEEGHADVSKYLAPGPLWWALDPQSAERRGDDGDSGPRATPPIHLPGYTPTRNGAVVLIDEIDKADSSFCNGLLVPLGSRQFYVPDIDVLVQNGGDRIEESPVIIITTNDERDLPEAFIRRCVVLAIPGPTAERLMEIAQLHFPVLDANYELRQQAENLSKRFDVRVEERAHASTAEFLDLIEVLVTMDVSPDSAEWRLVERLVVEKQSVRRVALSRW